MLVVTVLTNVTHNTRTAKRNSAGRGVIVTEGAKTHDAMRKGAGESVKHSKSLVAQRRVKVRERVDPTQNKENGTKQHLSKSATPMHRSSKAETVISPKAGQPSLSLLPQACQKMLSNKVNSSSVSEVAGKHLYVEDLRQLRKCFDALGHNNGTQDLLGKEDQRTASDLAMQLEVCSQNIASLNESCMGLGSQSNSDGPTGSEEPLRRAKRGFLSIDETKLMNEVTNTLDAVITRLGPNINKVVDSFVNVTVIFQKMAPKIEQTLEEYSGVASATTAMLKSLAAATPEVVETMDELQGTLEHANHLFNSTKSLMNKTENLEDSIILLQGKIADLTPEVEGLIGDARQAIKNGSLTIETIVNDLKKGMKSIIDQEVKQLFSDLRILIYSIVGALSLCTATYMVKSFCPSKCRENKRGYQIVINTVDLSEIKKEELQNVIQSLIHVDEKNFTLGRNNKNQVVLKIPKNDTLNDGGEGGLLLEPRSTKQRVTTSV